MADKLFLSHIDLNKNELKNALIHKVDTMPSNPKTGQIVYWNGTSSTYTQHKLYTYNGSAWVMVSGASYAAGDGLSLTGTTFAVDNTVVRTSGNQSISGNKNFNDRLTACSGINFGILGDKIYSTSQHLTIATPFKNQQEYGSVANLYLRVEGKAYYKKSESAVVTDNDELAVKGDLPNMSNYVTIATDQTITGAKTFTNNVTVGNGSDRTGSSLIFNGSDGAFNGYGTITTAMGNASSIDFSINSLILQAGSNSNQAPGNITLRGAQRSGENSKIYFQPYINGAYVYYTIDGSNGGTSSEPAVIATKADITSHAGIDKVGTVTSVAVQINGAIKGTITTSGTIDLGSNYVTGSGLTANKIILGNGTTTIKTSSIGIATTLGSDNITVPTSGAAKTYIDTQDGKLSDRIDNLSTLGRYLTGWDMATGTPTSLPLEASYVLRTGDYFVITNVPSSGTKYKPAQTGTWVTSEAFAKEAVTGTFKAGGIWKFNGTIWEYQETGAPIGLQPFTNSTLGGIKGKQQDGYVEADGDGFGKVNGWSSVVKTSGDQSIAGVKTFTDSIGLGSSGSLLIEDGEINQRGSGLDITSQGLLDMYASLGTVKLRAYSDVILKSGEDGKAYYYVDTIPSTMDATREIAVKADLASYQTKVPQLGSTTKPVYTSAAGTFAECSTYAGGTKVTLNGTDKGASTASFYAPTSAISTSTAKRYLVGSSATNSVATENTHANVYMQSGTIYADGFRTTGILSEYISISGKTLRVQSNTGGSNQDVVVDTDGLTIYHDPEINNYITKYTDGQIQYKGKTFNLPSDNGTLALISQIPDVSYSELALTFAGSGGEYSEVIKTTAPIQVIKVSTHEQVECKIVYSYTNGKLSGATITMNADSAPTGYAALCVAGSSLA